MGRGGNGERRWGKKMGVLMDVGGTYLKDACAFDFIFLSYPRPKRLARKREKYASTLANPELLGGLWVLTAGA